MSESTSATSLAILRLRPGAEKRLTGGHNWIYSNEVASPMLDYSAGQQVVVESDRGRTLGIATFNPHTLIAGRLISRDARKPLDKRLLNKRITQALSLRAEFPDPCYRLIYGDSDGLSGLVVDRFGDHLVAQISTAGMELLKPLIVDALVTALQPASILFRNDSSQRALEGLENYCESAYGDVPDYAELVENGTRLLAPIRHGQKTGWYYDHRVSRQLMQRYVEGKQVLDVFSYVGGWGVQALAAGAESATLVDSSVLALDVAHENAALNHRQEHITCLQGNAFEVLESLLADSRQFDVVIVDPPAFVKRRKDLPKGQQAYRRINELAMRLLSRGGLLVSASCSLHMERQMLMDVLRAAGRHVDRQVQVIGQGYQGADHPIHPAIRETEYLKAIFARINHI